MGNKPSQSKLPVYSPRQNSQSPESVHLSSQEARELLKVLDSTRLLLESRLQKSGNAGRTRSWWGFHCFPARRRFIAKYILLITAVLQSINLMVVSIIDIWPKREDQPVMDGTGITMMLLQFINLFVIVMVSARLVNQLKTQRVSVLLLAQSYVSTLLLFAGFYTLTYRLEPGSWKFIQERLEEDPILVIVLYSKFLFFSVSTATLCGSDNVLPQEWYNCLFTATQMLMSFVYFASILGQSLSQDTQYWLGMGTRHSRSPSKVFTRDSLTVLGVQVCDEGRRSIEEPPDVSSDVTQ